MKIELKYYAPLAHHSAWLVDDRYMVYRCPLDSACEAVRDGDELVTDAKLATHLLLEVAKYDADHNITQPLREAYLNS